MAQKPVQSSGVLDPGHQQMEDRNDLRSSCKGVRRREEKWHLARHKDLVPGNFSGLDEDWSTWKEYLEDYNEAVHPGASELLRLLGKDKGEIGEGTIRGNGRSEEEWTRLL